MATKQLQNLLQREAKLFEKFGRREDELQRVIVGRDWDALDAIIPDLERLSFEIQATEKQRHAAVFEAKASCGKDPETPFVEYLHDLDDTERNTLATLYRALQVAVLRVKSLTGGIDSYVRGSIRTSNAVLGELFPEQKGTMYSRNGTSSPAKRTAMVLDHEL